MDIDIPEDDVVRLRVLCGLGEYDPIPQKLETKYWELSRLCTRAQIQLTYEKLAFLCFLQGYGKPIERESNPSIVDLFRGGKVKYGDPVVVKWRNKDRGGVLKRVFGKSKVFVQMDGDTEEREFTPDQVRAAELVA